MIGRKVERLKGYSIAFLIITFFAFVFYQTQKSADFKVIRVDSPTQIIVDINQNGVGDKNEIISLDNIQSFDTKPSIKQSELAKKLNINEDNAMGLGYLAQNFAKETLEGKKVKVKNKVILINNKIYEDLLLNKGLALKINSESQPILFKKNIEKVQKLNLVRFNNKSHKLHKLTCKYGLIAHNSQIIPAFQLPKDAKPCRFCHSKGQDAKDKSDKWKIENGKWKIDVIPNIKSPPTTFQSNSIQLFLTDFTKVFKPTNSCNTQVCSALLNQINSAQSSIDFAIYGYTKIPALQQALENAQKRGVKVRFVYDLDKNNCNIYPDTNYLAKVFTDNRSDNAPEIMHDKFFIFDKKSVLTGSANISNTDMSGFNSNVVILINSEKIADIYSQEFEQMYNGQFHKQKIKINDKELNIDNSNFQIYFSPKDKGITAIIPLIDNAKKYIYIPAFLITHKGLTDSLINAQKRGVAVKVILDATNTHTSSSKMKMLRQAGIQVKTENFAGKLHSKSIIIDDEYTIIGSMNFSRSGEGANDENLIIIKNPEIAKFYKTFFQYLWQRIPDYWLTHNARSESPDSIGSCSDGLDNDFDGKIDKADESCKINKILNNKNYSKSHDL